MRERYEKRLFRIFEEAGYSPIRILTITPEEMSEPCPAWYRGRTGGG